MVSIRTPWIKREKIDVGIIRFILLIIAILAVFYISKISGVFVSPHWEHVEAITVDKEIETVTYDITFDEYKPINCEDGIYVSDGDIEIEFEVIDSEFFGGYCTKATIEFKNIIYSVDTEPGELLTEQETEKEKVVDVVVESGQKSIEEKEEAVRTAEPKDDLIVITGRGIINVTDLTGKVILNKFTGKVISSVSGKTTEDLTGSFQEEQFKTYYIFYGVVSGEITPPFAKDKEDRRAQSTEKILEIPDIAIVRPELPVKQTPEEENETINETLNQTINETVNQTINETLPWLNETIPDVLVAGITFGGLNPDTNLRGNFSETTNDESIVTIEFNDETKLNFGIFSINNQKLRTVNSLLYFNYPGTWYKGVIYKNVLDGVSIKYELGLYSVKEIIVLDEQPDITNDFVISEIINLKNIDKISVYDGSEVLSNGKREYLTSSSVFEKQTEGDKKFKSAAIGNSASNIPLNDLGKTIDLIETKGDIDFNTVNQTLFYIPKAEVYDADGESIPITYKIVKQDNKTVLNIIVDKDWLLDEARVYPVYIDPIVNVFNPTTNESDWINDIEAGRQLYALTNFINYEGDFIIDWINYTGAPGTTNNALSAKNFNDFSLTNLTPEYNAIDSSCAGVAIPSFIAGTCSQPTAFAGSIAGGEYIVAFQYPGATSTDIYTRWYRPGDTSETLTGINCGSGATAATVSCDDCDTFQTCPNFAASEDGERYLLCYSDKQSDGSNYETIGKLYNGVPTGYNYQTQPIVPSSTNGCTAGWCGTYEFMINTANGASPSVDFYCEADFQPNATNNFVACYARYTGSRYDTYCRYFNSTGTALTTAYAVESYTTSHSQPQDMVWLDNDRYVVAYREYSGAAWRAEFSIYFANGTAVLANQVVKEHASLQTLSPSVARLQGGQFVYTYETQDSGGYGYDIYAVIYFKNGTKAAGPQLVNEDLRTGDQRNARVESLLDTNKYVVTWDSLSDSNQEGVKSRLFDSYGPPETISDCTTISSGGDYNLTSGIFVSTSSDCIKITASNVELDCAGNTMAINGGYDAIDIASGVRGVTIKNCIINATNNAQGIDSAGDSINLINNTIFGGSSIGISVEGDDYTIVNNTVYGHTRGVQAFSSYVNHVISGNNLSNNDDYGIYLDGVDDSLIENNILNHNGDIGIYVAGGSLNNNFINNTANSNTNHGIYIRTTSHYNNVSDSTFNLNGLYGIFIADSGQMNFTNNNATGNTVYDFYTSGVTSLDNNIINLTINNIFSSFNYDGTLGLKSATAPAGGDPAGYQNIGKFINITNASTSPWIYINLSYDVADYGDMDESTLTMWKNSSGTWTNNINSTGINTVNPTNNFVSTYITSFGSIYGPMGEAPAITECQNITSEGDYELGSTIYGNQSDGTCIHILANNTNLDCKGYSINGNYTGTTAGVYAIGSGAGKIYNLTIVNCDIRNYSNGVSGGGIEINDSIIANTTTYGLTGGFTAYNLTIANNSRGVQGASVASGKGSLTIYNSVFEDNDEGIFIYTGTIEGNNFTGHQNYAIGVDDIQGDVDIISNIFLNNDVAFNLSGGTGEIYNNNFTNSPIQDDIGFTWNTTNSTGPNIIGGSYIGGNYYDDYSGYDNDGDGFGETTHTIPGSAGAEDELPLSNEQDPCYITEATTLSNHLWCDNGLTITSSGYLNTSSYNVTVVGDADISGNFKISSTAKLNVTGNVEVNSGSTLGSNSWSGDAWLGSIRIFSGGYFNTTSGTTTLTNRDGFQWALRNQGAFAHNDGTINFTYDGGFVKVDTGGTSYPLYNLIMATTDKAVEITNNHALVEGDLYIVSGNFLNAVSVAQAGWDIEVVGDTTVSGLMAMQTGYESRNHTFGNVTIESGGEYRSSNGTNKFNGNVVVNSGGTFNTSDNAVVNSTKNYTHNSGATTTMGTDSTWHVYGLLSTNTGYDSETSTIIAYDGAIMSPNFNSRDNGAYKFQIPAGATVYKTGGNNYWSIDVGGFNINGTFQYASGGNRDIAPWSTGAGSNYVGTSGDVSTIRLNSVLTNYIPTSTWYSIVHANGNTLYFEGDISVAADSTVSYASHWSAASSSSIDLQGYTFNASTTTGHYFTLGSSASGAGGMLNMAGGKLVEFSDVFVSSNHSAIYDDGSGVIQTDGQFYSRNGYVNLTSTTLNVTNDLTVNNTFIGGSGDYILGSLEVTSDGNYTATSGTTYIEDYIAIDGGTYTDGGGSFNLTGGSKPVEFKISDASNLNFSKVTPAPVILSGYNGLGYYIDIDDLGSGSISGFNITYEDTDFDIESNIDMWKNTSGSWTQSGIDDSGVDEANNLVWADISSFSIFGPLEDNDSCNVGPGKSFTLSENITCIDLNIAATGTLDANDYNVTITNDFNLNGTFTAGSGYHTIGNDWTINSGMVFTRETSTIELTKDGTANINLYTPITLNNIIMANANNRNVSLGASSYMNVYGTNSEFGTNSGRSQINFNDQYIFFYIEPTFNTYLNQTGTTGGIDYPHSTVLHNVEQSTINNAYWNLRFSCNTGNCISNLTGNTYVKNDVKGQASSGHVYFNLKDYNLTVEGDISTGGNADFVTGTGIINATGDVLVQNTAKLNLESTNPYFGSLTEQSGGNLTCDSCNIELTNETSGNYALDIDGAISGNVDTLIKTDSATYIDAEATSGYIRNMTIDNGYTNSMNSNPTFSGTLNITSGSGFVKGWTPGQTLTVNGDLIIEGLLGASDWTGKLTIGGHMEGTGTYTHGAQEAEFTGGNKFISNDFTFYDLTSNTGGGATVLGRRTSSGNIEITVENNLTIASGSILYLRQYTNGNTVTLTLGNSSQSATMTNYGELRPHPNDKTGDSVIQAASASYYADLVGDGTYDWDFGASTSRQVHWKWLKHQGTDATAKETGGNGVTIVLDEGCYFQENFNISSGDIFNEQTYRIYVYKNFTNEGSMLSTGTFKTTSSVLHYIKNINASEFQLESTGSATFDGDNYFSAVSWNGGTGDLYAYDSSSVLNVTGGIITPNSVYFGADSSGNLGDGTAASNWDANMTWGWFNSTLGSNYVTLTSGTTTITSQTGSRPMSVGTSTTLTHNSGTIKVITDASSQTIDFGYGGAKNPVYNFILDTPTSTNQFYIRGTTGITEIENDLTVSSGKLRTVNTNEGLDVAGNLLIENGGLFGSSASTGNFSFGGTTTINNGGEYISSTGENVFSGNVVVDNGGTFEAIGSSGTIWFNGNYITNGTTFWKDSTVRFNGTSDCQLSFEAQEEANLTVVNSTISNSGTDTNTFNTYLHSGVLGVLSIEDSYIEHTGDELSGSGNQDYLIIQSGANIVNNTFYTPESKGVYLITQTSDLGSNFTFNNISASYRYGLYVVSDYWNISHNDINIKATSSITGGHGLYLYGGSADNNTITYNNITSGTGTNSDSVVIGGDDNNIMNNNLYVGAAGSRVVTFQNVGGTSQYNIISNNDLHGANSDYAIHITSAASNNNFSNNNVSNCSYSTSINVDVTSTDNWIWDNYFFGAGKDDGTTTKWNITNSSGPNIIGGSYIGGNYWGADPGYDTDGDGFAQNPYSLSGTASAKDYLPLTDVDGCHITTAVTLNSNLYCETINITSTGSLDANDYNVSVGDYMNITGNFTAGSGTHYIVGDFTLRGTLTAESSTITVGGDWDSNPSTFTMGTSTVILNGTGVLNAENNYADRFYYLQLAYSGKTTTLANSLFMEDELRLEGGNLSMGTYNIATYEYDSGRANYVYGDANITATTGAFRLRVGTDISEWNNTVYIPNLMFERINTDNQTINITKDLNVGNLAFEGDNATRYLIVNLKGGGINASSMDVGDTYTDGGATGFVRIVELIATEINVTGNVILQNENSSIELINTEMNIDGNVTLEDNTKLVGGSGNHNFGTLTIESGGTYEATSGNTTLTSGPTTYNNSGTMIHNDGTFVWDSGTGDLLNTGGDPVYNFIVVQGTPRYQLNPVHIEGNLTIVSGTFRPSSAGSGPAQVLNVTGDVTVNGNFLTTVFATADHYYGSLTLNSGSSMVATSGNTYLNGNMAGTGSFNHNAGNVEFIKTTSGSTIDGAFTFYNLTANNGASQTLYPLEDTIIENALNIEASSIFLPSNLNGNDVTITLGNSTKYGTIENSGTLRGHANTYNSYDVIWQGVSNSYRGQLTGSGVYDWDYGTTNGEVHWGLIEHKGTDSSAKETGGGGVTIVIDDMIYFFEDFNITSGDTMTADGTDNIAAVQDFRNFGNMNGINILYASGYSNANRAFENTNSSYLQIFHNGDTYFDGDVIVGSGGVSWNPASYGDFMAYDSDSTLNVEGGINVNQNAYFGANSSNLLGDGSAASTWDENMSWGWFLINGSTMTLPTGTVELTSESTGGYIIERSTLGGSITAPGTLNITYPGATSIYMRSFSPSYTLGDVVVDNSGNTLYFQSAYVNNLTQESGLVRGASNGDGFDASGNVIVNGGTLGHSTWSRDTTFGSLTVNSGSTFYAPTGTTTITSENSAGYAVQYNGGDMNHDNGKYYINTSGATKVSMFSSTAGKHIYDLEYNSSGGTLEFYDHSGYTVQNDFTIDKGVVKTTGTTSNFAVVGDALIDNGSLGYNTWTGTATFGTLTIDTDGEYNATSGVTKIDDYMSIDGGTYTYNSGSVNISGTNTRFATASNVKLEKVTSPPTDPDGYSNISYYVNITNLTPTGGFGGDYFNITYEAADPTDETRLEMWKYNGSDWTQTGIVSEDVDTTNNYVWSNISSFSIFAPLEDTKQTPVVTLNKPEEDNNTINLQDEITFNCSVTDGDNNLKNLTLYTNLGGTVWNENGTDSITGLSNSSQLLRNMSNFIGENIFMDISSQYNCLVYDDTNLYDWGDNNYTFSGWDLGTHDNTTVNGDFVNISGTDTSGIYESKIFDADNGVDWNNISFGIENINVTYGSNVASSSYANPPQRTASSTFSGYTTARINDGSIPTNIGTLYDFATLNGAGTDDWIKYNWSTSYTFGKVGLYWRYGASGPDEYWIQVSNDDFSSDIRNATVCTSSCNSDHDATFSAISGKYLRIFVPDGQGGSYFPNGIIMREFQVYEAIPGSLSVSVRASDDSGMSGASWSSWLELDEDYFVNLTNVVGTYFQYKISMLAPTEIHNTTIRFTERIEPYVTLNLPIDDNATVNLSDINFNCSAVDYQSDLKNSTLYHNVNGTWLSNGTDTLSGSGDSSEWNIDIFEFMDNTTRVDTGVEWNCLVYDTSGNSAWAFSNDTFSDWDLGTHDNTTVFDGKVNLSGSNTGGVYTSRIFNASTSSVWEDIAWEQTQGVSDFDTNFALSSGSTPPNRYASSTFAGYTTARINDGSVPNNYGTSYDFATLNNGGDDDWIKYNWSSNKTFAGVGLYWRYDEVGPDEYWIQVSNDDFSSDIRNATVCTSSCGSDHNATFALIEADSIRILVPDGQGGTYFTNGIIMREFQVFNASGLPLSISVRASDSSDMSGASWSSWYITSPTVLSGITGQYFQYKANITGEEPPTLDRMDINFTLGSNNAPTISSLVINPTPITLIPCGNVSVNCTATVADEQGYSDIDVVKAVLYNDDLVNNDCTANNTKCYRNDSCILTSCSGTSCTANCTFWNVRYYAKAGTWKCNVTVNDSESEVNSSEASATLSNLTAIQIPAGIDFGTVGPGNYSNNISHNVENCGNYEIDTKHNGTNMECSLSTNDILVGNISYSATQSGGYTSLTSALTRLEINISAAITDAGSDDDTWWRLFVPIGFAGTCSGNVTFLAVQSI